MTTVSDVTWQEGLRLGFAPQLDDTMLERLRDALLSDDPRLLQGQCCQPVQSVNGEDPPAIRACFLGIVAMLRDPNHTPTITEVCVAFSRMLHEADKRLRPHCRQGGRVFIDWYDATPWHHMRKVLAAELDAILWERRNAPHVA